MNIPENLHYTKEHEWIRIDEDQSTDDRVIAYVGITDFAQSELGEIVYVEVETVGETLDRDEVFGTVEAVKTTSDLFLPLSGEILEFNKDLDENEGDNPALLNEDPYHKGWIIKMALSDASQTSELLSSTDYHALVS